ncbi:nuclear transport factor 2 family protein [Pedobacter nutrimenti]|uniref:Ketosteroid isomerase-like protein n=1 Tax=Pedobacter nutrimenti TaxID=1241337 RepID=A0A318ULZ6_9SPHI|nr:nuclear transport factor 2 family protein [Pedobacter nutrimenti]PYF77422.1 ketosteroid isomerase-like protein [Pedobacter nutrimenti]
MSAHHKTILEKANAAITKGDYEGFLAFCTENTTWTFVGDTVLEGKEAVRKYMSVTYLEPPKFQVEQLLAEGDFVTAIGRISLKDTDDKMTDYDYCDIWRFEEGKMAELKAFVIESRA